MDAVGSQGVGISYYERQMQKIKTTPHYKIKTTPYYKKFRETLKNKLFLARSLGKVDHKCGREVILADWEPRENIIPCWINCRSCKHHIEDNRSYIYFVVGADTCSIFPQHKTLSISTEDQQSGWFCLSHEFNDHIQMVKK
jgi:hypothetical protein